MISQCEICNKEFFIKNHSDQICFSKHKIWCKIKRDFLIEYDLGKERIQDEINILGFSGFVRKFPYIRFNHGRLIKELDIQKIKQTECLVCEKIFYGCSPVTQLLKHNLWCQSRKEYLEKYNLTKELLTQEYERLGSILEFIKYYPNSNWKSWSKYYKIFKDFGIAISISKSQSNVNTKERTKKSNIEKYGSPHNFCKEHPSRIKWEKEMFEKFGVTNIFQREDIIDKIQNIIIEKYGNEFWKHILTIRGKGVVSSINKRVFSILEENNIDFSIEFKIKRDFKKYYAYDIFLKNNKIIEVYGDYWHCNPELFDENFLLLRNTSGELTAKEKWKKDREKINFAISKGYNVLIIWEKDLNKNHSEVIKRILDYAKN